MDYLSAIGGFQAFFAPSGRLYGVSFNSFPSGNIFNSPGLFIGDYVVAGTSSCIRATAQDTYTCPTTLENPALSRTFEIRTNDYGNSFPTAGWRGTFTIEKDGFPPLPEPSTGHC